MKSTLIVFVVVAVCVALMEASRQYSGASGPSVEEDNYGLFRHMGPNDRVVNLPGGEHARHDYQLRKLQDRLANKAGVNQLRRRRSAPEYLPQDDDDMF